MKDSTISITVRLEPLEDSDEISETDVSAFENWLADVVASYDAGMFRAEVA